MDTITLFDLATRGRLNDGSIETRGPAGVRNIGGQFQIEGPNTTLIRMAAPGHIPQYKYISNGNVASSIYLRPTSALPNPIHGGNRLTWDELRHGFLPDWDQVSVTSQPARPGTAAFRLTTQPGIWWKAVKLFNRAGVICQDLQSEEGRPAFGLTRDFNASTLRGAQLVLAKAKFLGFHTDMYEVVIDDATLAQVIGFTWTFNWIMQ